MFFHANSLDERNLMNFRFYLSLRYNYGDFNIFLYFSYLNLGLIDDFGDFNFNYFILFNYPEHLSNHLYFFWWQLDDLLHSYNLFDDLGLNNKYLLCMNNWDDFLNNLLHYFYSCLYMGNNLRNLLISNNLHYFFHNLRYNNYLLSLYNLFYDFLNNNFNWFDDLFFGLDVSDYFFNNLYWLQLSLNNNFIFLNDNRLLSLHYFFFYNFFSL